MIMCTNTFSLVSHFHLHSHCLYWLHQDVNSSLQSGTINVEVCMWHAVVFNLQNMEYIRHICRGREREKLVIVVKAYHIIDSSSVFALQFILKMSTDD